MVLPTLLAACTADEIVENNNNAVLSNRAEVEAVTFTAEGLESRLAYEEGAWKWEDTDKFLLLNADDGTKADNEDEIPGDYFTAGKPTTGYEYEKGADGKYTTSASVMTEGLYWGFAPSFNKSYKGYVEYTLDASQDQDYWKDPANQAFITPLYEIVDGENFNNTLPLEMINWYSTLVMPLTNSTKEDITLNQIVLTADKEFVIKGLVNTSEMGSYIMAYNGEEWAPAQNFDDDDENDLTYDPAKGKNELIAGNDDFGGMRKAYLIATNDDSKTSKTIVLNLNEVVLEAGETETFYMLVPASDGKISCEITIIAEEGVIKIDKSADSNKMKNTQIYHNGSKHAFGTITSGKNKGEAKAYNITAGKFEDVTGAYYVASYQDMMDHIETVNGTFFAYNVGDWNLDADMAAAIKESDAFVVFMNDINIEGKAISRATEDKGLELEKVAFAATATVLEDTKVTFASEGGDYEEAEGTEDYEEIVENACVANLIVEKGADVTLVSGEYHAINNAGTLTVASTADFTEASIENAGVLNLVETNAEAITLKGGELNYKVAKAGNEWATDNANVTFALAANAKITVAEGVTLANKVANNAAWRTTQVVSGKTVTKHAISVENNGDIELVGGAEGGDMTIWGTLTNNGNITSASNTLRVMNTATNGAEAKIKVLQFVNYGTFTNNGDLRKDTNDTYGNTNWNKIIVGAGSRTDIDAALDEPAYESFQKEARINNSVAAVVNVAKTIEQIVYCEFEDADEIDLEAVKYASRGINTLRIIGTLTLNRNFGGADAPSTWATEMAGLKRLELANNAEVEVFANDIKIGVSEVVLDGNATISGTQESESAIEFRNAVAEVNFTVYDKAVASGVNKGYELLIDGAVVKAADGHAVTVTHVDEETTTNKPNLIDWKTVVEDAKWFEGVTITAGAASAQ